MDDILVTGVEFKFAQDGATGAFSGYASVFNHQDAHGDVVKPGAFAESLAERKASGRTLPMHVMHGIFGGDGVPVGVWNNVAEDSNGLAVEGKISGMNTDAGRLLYERVKDGALGGLSIGYKIKAGGSKLGKGAGEPKRTISAVHLHEISLVDDPSNAMARVTEVKAASTSLQQPDKALTSLVAAILERRSAGLETDPLLEQMLDVHEALTGKRTPAEMKAAPKTIREFEAFLRDGAGFSNSMARDIAALGFKAATAPRDEDGGQAKLTADAVAEFGPLAGFSLPKF